MRSPSRLRRAARGTLLGSKRRASARVSRTAAGRSERGGLPLPAGAFCLGAPQAEASRGRFFSCAGSSVGAFPDPPVGSRVRSLAYSAIRGTEPDAAMERHTGLLLIALALVVYGVYHALYAVAMLPGPTSLLLFLGFALQAVLAILAALGVWRRQPWAAAVLLLLGVSIAATALVEAFVLGIIGWLYALLIAIGAVVIALLLGAYVTRSGSLLGGRGGSPQA